MLISPVLGILYITYIPKLLQNNLLDISNKKPQDSIVEAIEAIKFEGDSLTGIDSLIQQAEHVAADTIFDKPGINIDFNQQGGNGNFSNDEGLFFNSLLVALLLAFAFSVPFKIYFRRKRKERTIPRKIEQYCRKTILYSPIITAIIISIPFIVQHINFINQLYISDIYKEDIQREMHQNYWLIFLLSSILTIAFVYMWQKHNMQLKYIF